MWFKAFERFFQQIRKLITFIDDNVYTFANLFAEINLNNENSILAFFTYFQFVIQSVRI